MVDLIKKTDTLNQGREKLNNAITAFNETVVEGDSSVEAAQARVDEIGRSHPTLKARIDDGFTEVKTQLAQLPTQEQVNAKRDKNVKLTKDDLDTSTDSVKLTEINLSETLLKQIVGTTPIGSVPADGSITNEKLADGAISRRKSGTSLGGMQDGMYFNNMDYQITRDGTSIKIKFTPSTIGYYKNVERRDRIELAILEYTIPHNHSLVYSIGTYDRFLVKNTDELSILDYIILNCHNGSDKINKLKEISSPFNDILYTSANFIYDISGTDIVVKMEGSLKRVFVKSGYRKQDRYYAGTSDIVFTVPANNALVYNLYINDIVVRSWDILNIDDVVLLGNYGGEVVQNNINATLSNADEIDGKVFNAGYVVNTKENTVKSGLNIGQGITFIGDYFLAFDESLDDHSDYGVFHIYDKNTWQLVKTVEHNIGHCNAVDYNPRNDKLLIGNNTGSGQIQPPELYIFNNASEQFLNQDRVTFETADKTVIKLHNASGDLGNYGEQSKPNACWGENDNIVYVILNQNKVMYRLFLGLGNANLLTKPDSWGEYQETTSDKYNGTCRVLGVYHANNYYGVVQGMTYHNGKIYIAQTHGQILTVVYDLLSNGVMRMVDAYDSSIRGHLGDVIAYEPEGVAIDNGKLYQGYRGNSKGVVITELK